MGEIGSRRSVDVGLAQLVTARDLLLQKETIELATFVNDYPYGFRLRCKIRYWLEYKRGHGHRLVSQTTNPKVAGEDWNKPKGNTYYNGPSVLFVDEH